MAKPALRYVCQSCGAASPKWTGRCESCGAWNSLVEEIPRDSLPVGRKTSGKAGSSGRNVTFSSLEAAGPAPARLVTGIAEFDRVVGGGLVRGSAVLVAGDPGIGKSTIVLRIAGALSSQARVAYVSGEEAVEQIRLRARRLQLAQAPVLLAAAT